MKPERVARGFAALLIGCLIIHFGDRLLGVQIDLFRGLGDFNFMWMLDMFVVPGLAGLSVGAIFGLGGKWLCYFPPLLVRLYSFYRVNHGMDPIPADASLEPMGWWGFMVILNMIAAAFGGVAGEIMVKETYGRSAPDKVRKTRKTRVLADEEGES